MPSPARGAGIIIELKKGLAGKQGKYGKIGAPGNVASGIIRRVHL